MKSSTMLLICLCIWIPIGAIALLSDADQDLRRYNGLYFVVLWTAWLILRELEGQQETKSKKEE